MPIVRIDSIAVARHKDVLDLERVGAGALRPTTFHTSF